MLELGIPNPTPTSTHGLNKELQEKVISDHLRSCQSRILQGEVYYYTKQQRRSHNGSLQGRKNRTWRAADWNGERKQTQKERGFKTAERQAWERNRFIKPALIRYELQKFCKELYTADMKTRPAWRTLGPQRSTLSVQSCPLLRQALEDVQHHRPADHLAERDAEPQG